MNIYAPAEAHATTEPGGYCAAHEEWEDAPLHDAVGTVWRSGEVDGRLWQISADAPVTAVNLVPVSMAHGAMRTAPAGLVLAPGTRLRIDREITDYISRFSDWRDIMRRFCVLDGPMAGTCWQAWDRPSDGTRDPVEPVGA